MDKETKKLKIEALAEELRVLNMEYYAKITNLLAQISVIVATPTEYPPGGTVISGEEGPEYITEPTTTQDGYGNIRKLKDGYTVSAETAARALGMSVGEMFRKMKTRDISAEEHEALKELTKKAIGHPNDKPK